MTISQKSWEKYIEDLRKLNEKAADLMTKYLETHEHTTKEGRQAAIEYGYALAVRYGEGAAEKACQMYDAVAATAKKRIPPAEPAATATISEVARTINGTLKQSQRADVVGQAVGRLVKRTGVDTTLNNALRDGAEWAWIPNGDSCPFCLMLASNGWQKASKKAIKQGHAEHIHANCDCTYAVRFDGVSTVEGYDPGELLQQYYAAEGYSSKDKINYMRRAKYAKNKDAINAQKRAAYAKSNKQKRSTRRRGVDVTKQYIQEADPRHGNIEFERGFQIVDRKNEVETARIIHRELGGDIVLKAELPGQKNPDYEWMGALWDLKNTSTEKSANSAIKSGMKQIRSNPGGVILNFGENEVNINKLIETIELRMGWYPDKCADIVIIRKDKIVKIIRY